jgi:phosphoribosylamine--glycine ligase
MRQSPRLAQLLVAPGNAGTAALGDNVDVDPTDFAAVKALVLSRAVSLVVVGPEEPLVRGIVDYFAADEALRGIPVVGPSQQGAQLEGSKDFAKRFMARHGIPTARYRSFTRSSAADGAAFLATLAHPYVLKADGLAAGKGVLIVDSLAEAQAQLQAMLGGMFGEASRTVVVEEFLRGVELSVFALTDGASYKLLPEAKDYKRVGEGDAGPNTGGMGSVSPVPFATPEFMEKVRTRIVEPTIAGLRAERIAYRGFLFFGLIRVEGNPMLIEYNVRMGDPETQSVMLRLDADLVDLLEGAACGTLAAVACAALPQAAATVVCASGGYPGTYRKGFPIRGLERVGGGAVAFHAGTRLRGGAVETDGGRVLALAALAPTPLAALSKAYEAVEQVDYEGKLFRRDIGKDVL